MKRTIIIISIIVLIITMLITSILATFYYFADEMSQTEMFYITTSKSMAENDTHIVIERAIISKADGTVRRLKLSSAEETEYGKFYYSEEDAYEYEFCEDTIKEYIFLHNDNWNYNCVITYGYDGIEISRSYIESGNGDLKWTDAEKRIMLYIRSKSDYSDKKTYSFTNEYDYYNSDTEYHLSGSSPQYIKDLVELLHQRYLPKKKQNKNYISLLTQKSGNEILFSTAASNGYCFPHADPTINGIHHSELLSYNVETKEIKPIYDCKKDVQIIDFNGNGIYTIDAQCRLRYVDIKTKKSKLICDLHLAGEDFVVTDKYIFTRGGNNYFLYEKGGSVIANSMPVNLLD